MKKIFVLIMVIALIIAGGGFAATYQTASAGIGVTNSGGDFAEVTAANVSGLAPTVYGDFIGTFPSGTLFTVVPSDNYTGDLAIRAYLTNSGDLSIYYEHLNMELQYWSADNTTADDQGESQLLTLDNAEVLFTWSSGVGTGPYKVELVGGGFRLHPYKAVPGGSVQPEVWLQVYQR